MSNRNPFESRNARNADEGLTRFLFIVKWAGIALGAILLFFMLWPFDSVPTGSRGVITQFGRIVSIEPEGLVVLPPWRHLTLFSIRAEAANIDNASGSTKDTQPVETSLTVRYGIFPDKVAYVFENYSHSGDLSSYVQTATQEVFKAITAKYVATDLITQRATVSGDINITLQEKLDKYGAHVINIDMRNFGFSPSYMHAINEKVTQEQLRLAAENKVRTVEAEQRQRVAVAEAEANMARATANGRADAAKAQADGSAYSTLKNAEANSNALKLQNTALAQSKDVLALKQLEVQLAWAEHWTGTYPQIIGSGAPAAFMNIPFPPPPAH